jgi:hypothetical protein
VRDHRRQPAETATSAQPGPISFASETVGRRRLILVGMAGNVMEWYDFSVYGYVAATPGAAFLSVRGRHSLTTGRLGLNLRRHLLAAPTRPAPEPLRTSPVLEALRTQGRVSYK